MSTKSGKMRDEMAFMIMTVMRFQDWDEDWNGSSTDRQQFVMEGRDD